MNNDNQAELLLFPLSHNTSFLWCLEHLLHGILLANSLLVPQLGTKALSPTTLKELTSDSYYVILEMDPFLEPSDKPPALASSLIVTL